MPRQNFISKDFFVPASEQHTRQSLLEIPRFIRIIKFQEENTILQSMHFLYERSSGHHHQIDVSLMPLYDGQTRVMLRARHANGHSFHKDRYLTNAIQNFEAALHAAIKRELPQFIPKEVKENKAQKIFRQVTVFLSAAGLFFFWRKFS